MQHTMLCALYTFSKYEHTISALLHVRKDNTHDPKK